MNVCYAAFKTIQGNPLFIEGLYLRVEQYLSEPDIDNQVGRYLVPISVIKTVRVRFK